MQGHAVTVVTQTTDHYSADSKMAETEGPTPLVPEAAELSQFYPAAHLILTPDLSLP
jgi:hypothetical protein